MREFDYLLRNLVTVICSLAFPVLSLRSLTWGCCFSLWRSSETLFLGGILHFFFLLDSVRSVKFLFTTFSEEKAKGNFRIKEEDVLKVIRLILPAVNAAIVAIQRIFSGEPSTTLMVENFRYYFFLKRIWFRL